MDDFLASRAAGWLGIVMLALGAGAAVIIATATPNSPVRAAYDRYVASIHEEVRFLLLKRSAEEIVRMQMFGLAAVLALWALTGNILFVAGIFIVGIYPRVSLKRQRQQKVEKLEMQLDGWLLMLANALKATPAIGEALNSTVNLVQPPMRDELDLLVKENQLGTPLDQAILNASERIGSPIVSGALAMLVVARQTGGDLPKILETSAASLREMARLEGVVRTKTAEGKGQVWVLGALPWGLVLLLAWMDPAWFSSLTENFIGNIIVAMATGCYAAALVWARNILSVDI
ncbi:MAG: type II secretion system F family protein [Deltaproteobacteria bacterium]|nr:type II secretion system F family protein [Deltaproteobacteria bacterium]